MRKIFFLILKFSHLVLIASFLLFSSIGLNADAKKIKILGNKRISDETIILLSGLSGSAKISSDDVNEALKKLTRSGLFSNVKIGYQNEFIAIEVDENPVISEVVFEGNKVLGSEDLSSIIGSSSNNAYSKETVVADVKSLAEFYKSKGRFNAVITPQYINSGENYIKLIFNINEGDLLEVEEIFFIGNREFSDKKLLSVIPSRKKGLFSFITDSDNYSEAALSKDRVALEKFYKSNGFIDVRISSALAVLSANKSTVTLSYKISEGPKYSIGNITFDSKALDLDQEDYRSDFYLKKGDTFNKEKVDTIITELEQRVISSGKPLAKVKLTTKKTKSIGTIDLKIVFENNQKLFVERIEIRGNNQTLDEVIRREFDISEGDAFNPLVLRKTEEKLRALGFFDKVKISVRGGQSIEKAIIIVDVSEAPTGSLNFGAGYSTDTSVTGSLSVSERNLLGKGQKLNFNLSVAKSAKTLHFGFTEPAFLNRDVSAGINLAFKQVDPLQSTYTSNSSSISPSLGFAIGPNSRLSLSYKIEDLKINSTESNSIVLQADHGRYLDSSINSTLVYDRRNSIVEPTDGYILRFSSTLSGLGGDIGYLKNAIRGKYYKGILDGSVVFSGELEGGLLDTFKGHSRVTDRFKLGGRNFRGFQFGEIGPRDTEGEALGGEKYLMSRLETNFPLGLPEELGLYGGVFSELGSLWSVKAKESVSNSVLYSDKVFRRSAGVSLYWSTPIGPLQFNWSKPLQYVDGVDVTEAFSLNLATRF